MNKRSYLWISEVGLAYFDGVDVDVEEIQGVGPAAEDVGARLNPPRPVGEVERTKTSKV